LNIDLELFHAASEAVVISVQVKKVCERAALGLFRHPLRAGDALQPGAALTWARGRPRAHGFLSFDERLATAARREGFDTVALGT